MRIAIPLMVVPALLVTGPAHAQEGEPAAEQPESVTWEEVEVDDAPVCLLTLDVTPEDSFVMIDGKLLGKAPVAGFECPAPGEHTLTVQKEGHVDVKRTFVMGEAPQTLTVALVEESSAGKLVVVSEVPGFEISVDGVEMGLVPWQGGLDPGPHEIVVTTPGEQTSTSSVTLEAGDEKLINVKPPPEKKKVGLHWAFLTGAAGLAVAGGIATLATGVAAKKHHDEWVDFRNDIVSGEWTGANPRPKDDEMKRKGQALNGGLAASLICMGVGLAATAVLLPLTDFSKKKVEVQASPAGGSIKVKF